MAQRYNKQISMAVNGEQDFQGEPNRAYTVVSERILSVDMRLSQPNSALRAMSYT